MEILDYSFLSMIMNTVWSPLPADAKPALVPFRNTRRSNLIAQAAGSPWRNSRWYP